MQRFATHLRVRHYEMDALGHVNNAVYQHYLEQAAVEHSASLGFSLDRYREIGGLWVLRRIEIEYRRPAVAGDHLVVSTWLHEMRGPRAMRRYEIHKENDLILHAQALWAWVDLQSLRPRPIPQVILDAFTQPEGS